MRVPQAAPMRYLLLAIAAWMTVLLLNHLDEAGAHVLPVFGIGQLYDLGFLAYAALPLGLYLLLYPPGPVPPAWPSRVPPGTAHHQPTLAPAPGSRPGSWRSKNPSTMQDLPCRH